jgi:hypothetical protein
MLKNTYIKKKFLNSDASASTGAIVVYDGQAPWTMKKQRTRFIEVSDCHQSIRLHQATQDSLSDYTAKVSALIKVLQDYKKHLKTCKN